jgi:hypothetical protein
MRLKQKFPARGSDDSQHEVCVYVRDIDTSTLVGRSSMEGMPHFRTSSGLTLNHHGKGRYEIVETGMLLTSDDPEAI